MQLREAASVYPVNTYLARRLPHDLRIGAVRHRQHDVEGLAPMPHFVDQRAAVVPLLYQVVQCLLALAHDTAVVLDVELPFLLM